MKNFVILFILGFFAFTNAFAQVKQSIGADTLKVGNSANAYNPTIEFSGTNVKVRANKTSGVAEFSNDGSLWKKMGSGSGAGDGGISILENASFEDGLTPGWTSSGGTFSQQSYTNNVEGELKFARFVATTSGQYFETSLKAIPDFANGGCLAKINYNTTDAANWKLQIYDASSNLLKEEILYIKSWADGYAAFPCPAAGTQIKARVISLAAGQIEADKGYLGKENRTFQTPPSKLVGAINFPSGCGWALSNVGSYTSFSTAAGCAAPTVTGLVKVAGTTIPAVTIPAGSSKGSYRIIWNGAISAVSGTPTTTNCAFRLWDGTTGYALGNVQHVSNNSTNLTTAVPSMTGLVTLTSDLAADATYQLQAYSVDGANANRNCGVNGTGSYGPVVSVEYLGDATKTALSSEAQDWFVDVSIGGSNPAMSNASVSTYSEITDAGLTLTPNDGSRAAKIPCSTTNSSTGPTCSVGNEGLGVVFTNPTPGFYEACASFSHDISIPSGGNSGTAFQLIQTANNSQTIIQEGKSKSFSRLNGTTFEASHAIYNCGSFYFSDVSEKTIRLMYEHSVGGTVTFNRIVADQGSSAGQRDVHIIVRPLLSPYSRNYLSSDQVLNEGATNPKSFIVSYGATSTANTVCSSNPCGFDQLGTAVSSIGYTTTGTYTLNTVRTYSKLKCLHVPNTASNNGVVSADVMSCTNCNSLTFGTAVVASSRVNSYGQLFCEGI